MLRIVRDHSPPEEKAMPPRIAEDPSPATAAQPLIRKAQSVAYCRAEQAAYQSFLHRAGASHGAPELAVAIKGVSAALQLACQRYEDSQQHELESERQTHEDADDQLGWALGDLGHGEQCENKRRWPGDECGPLGETGISAIRADG
jgi:hypothetical protein